MTKLRQVLAVCILLVLAVPALAEEQGTLYRMQEGDTLAELAEVYMGGREFAPELLAFNNIQNATAIGPGSLTEKS